MQFQTKFTETEKHPTIYMKKKKKTILIKRRNAFFSQVILEGHSYKNRMLLTQHRNIDQWNRYWIENKIHLSIATWFKNKI